MLTVAGAAVGVVLLMFLGLLATAAMTGNTVPLPGWPDTGARAQQEGQTGDLTTTPGPAPTGTTGPGAVVTPRPSAPSGAVATDIPGQGDEHRNTTPPRSTRSPGKPR